MGPNVLRENLYSQQRFSGIKCWWIHRKSEQMNKKIIVTGKAKSFVGKEKASYHGLLYDSSVSRLT